MNELYGASEIAEPASAARSETSSGRETGSHPDATHNGLGSYSDADIEAFLDAQQRQPESRTRQETVADTWADAGESGDDDPGAYSGDPASEYDGDVAALLATEQRQPESGKRQEAAAVTWDDTTEPGDDDPDAFSGDPASEYDGDVGALLAAEQRQPESRTRQDVAADTWSNADDGQDGEADPSISEASPGQPDTVTETPASDVEGEDAAPDPYERPVAVHASDGTEVPITVDYLPPEARTVGDTTPTGIGRKPTGDELSHMEGDNPRKSPLDGLLKEVTEDAQDARDAATNIGETVHNFHLPGPGPGSGHAHEVQPVHEPAPPAGPASSDFVGSAALVGVALLTGIRYGIRHLGKGDES